MAGMLVWQAGSIQLLLILPATRLRASSFHLPIRGTSIRFCQHAVRPRIRTTDCTLLLSVVAQALTRRRLLPFVRFLDDFLFISNTDTRMRTLLMLSEQTFHAFGLVVNVEKTEGPAQQLVFLGILFDSLASTPSRCAPCCTSRTTASVSACCSRLPSILVLPSSW
jgi:hypothetical protein